MTTVAQLIIEKLTAIEDRLAQIEQRIDNQDTAFLNEIVKPEKTATVSVTTKRKRKRTTGNKHAKHLPHRIATKLLEDHELAESTRNTYANTLRRLLENTWMVPTLIAKRNQGVPYEYIARDPQFSDYNSKRLQNMVSVGLRYGVIEREQDGKYREGKITA
jgi:hypothetical protein